jgi:hypothetical protein
MTSLVDKFNYATSISEAELEVISNYLVRESFDIITEEVDYYFDQQERILHVLIDGVNFEKLKAKDIEQGFNKIINCHQGLENLINRIEKRITKEFNRAQLSHQFSFQCLISNDIEDEISPYVKEHINTNSLSKVICKGINCVWQKSSAQILPKGLCKLPIKFNPGEYFLGYLGVSFQEIILNTKNKIVKVMKGVLKHRKLELRSTLMKDIVYQLITDHNKENEPFLLEETIMTA